MVEVVKVNTLERREIITVEWLEAEEDIATSRNGRIFISDGRIYVIPPVNNGVPALLNPGTSIIRMYINGEIARGPVPLDQGKRIEVVFPYVEPEASLLISQSANGLQAAIAARFKEGLIYTLQDAPPSEHLTLSIMVSERIAPERFSKEQVVQFLKDNGINYGILPENIDYFVESQSSDYITIAKGLPVVPPIDARIDFKVGLETEKIKTDDDDIRVDYRNRYFIPSVKEGELLAEKVLGQKGKPGIKVTGEEIPVNEPKDVELKAGKGAKLSPDGNYVYAMQSGRPIYRNREIIVEPIFIVEGSIDLKQGNVSFAGDVLVKGDVQPNFTVNSGREVEIRGTVVRANVRSRANMVVRGNVVSSKLVAAASQTPYTEIIKLYAKIIFSLRKIVAGVNQIKHASEGLSKTGCDGQFITQLIDLKFADLPLVIKRLGDIPIDADDDLAPALKESTAVLVDKLTGYGPRKIRNVEELKTLSDQLLHLGRELEERSRYTSADISIPYAQNAHIEATGKVIISRGCYYSDVISGEGIELEPGSFFRGGSMTLFEGDIKAGTIGSPAGAKTEITIVKNGVVTANEVFPNVQVSINMRRYTFSSQYNSVKMYLNKDGSLEFEGLKSQNMDVTNK